MQSDSTLLQSWCQERSQGAFAELVRRYERLVAGAALRRAGDFELARDVSQQVFTMLAAKAPLLVDRSTIAGWLYRAASHVAAQLRRADLRRQARHVATAACGANASGDHWPLLEDALAQLSGSDREAILLHYFQDLSYPEMATELGIAEAAARKRVSRAVQSLGQTLRKHGLCARSLLAAAVAVQATYPAHATLAGSALAGASTISVPLTLTVHALMSHLPLKIAVCAAGLALLPLGYQWNANATLHSELAEARTIPAAQASPLPPSPAHANLIAETRVELARVEAKIKSAEARAAELASFKTRANDELVVSLGSVEAMAKTFGTTLRQLTELRDAARGKQTSLEPEKREAMVRDIQTKMSEFFTLLRELPRLERDPARAARFYATMLAETGEFDTATRDKLEPVLQAWIKQLQRDSLALPQRPPIEQKDATAEWDKRRIAAMQEISKQLEALVPPEKAGRASLLRSMMIDPDEPSVREAFDMISGPGR